jgi:hypothetical protein
MGKFEKSVGKFQTSGKKCIPGVICIENMTLFLILLIFLLSIYLFFVMTHSVSENKTTIVNNEVIEQPIYRNSILSNLEQNNVFSNPFFPPLKPNIGFINGGGGIYTGGIGLGIPINIETQRTGGSAFNQIGILTRSTNNELILPIFGRLVSSNRDKWQYYTLSNTGNISSKLPVLVNGKDGMSEYGVSEIFNGDVIYVQGYNESFNATIYDSRSISYIPYL